MESSSNTQGRTHESELFTPPFISGNINQQTLRLLLMLLIREILHRISIT